MLANYFCLWPIHLPIAPWSPDFEGNQPVLSVQRCRGSRWIELSFQGWILEMCWSIQKNLFVLSSDLGYDSSKTQKDQPIAIRYDCHLLTWCFAEPKRLTALLSFEASILDASLSISANLDACRHIWPSCGKSTWLSHTPKPPSDDPLPNRSQPHLRRNVSPGIKGVWLMRFVFLTISGRSTIDSMC